ncbi:hypothetical protein ACJJTC_016018 [Scirpophaga incertulas]
MTWRKVYDDFLLSEIAFFCRLQNIYGAAKDVFSDENSKEKFLADSQTLEILRNDFNKITDQIIDIELQINPDAEPNFQCLNSFDELYSYCKYVISKLSLKSNTNSDNTELKIFSYEITHR